MDMVSIHSVPFTLVLMPLTICRYYCKLHVLETALAEEDVNSQNLVRMWRDQDEALLNTTKGEVPVESFAVMCCILYLLMFLWSSVSVCIPIEQFNSMSMATCSMDLEKMREKVKGGGDEGGGVNV